MPHTTASSSGDRIDFGGKVPQFELFADKVYTALTQRTLAWIKVGDPEAGNADDIQYATHSEVRAYQVKWSQQTKKPPYSYLNFIRLFPELRQSWLDLTKANAASELPVYIYLVSNRPPSEHDRLIIEGTVPQLVGSFSDFLTQAWPAICSGISPQGDWSTFFCQEFKKLGLTESEFLAFAQHLRLEFDATLPLPIDHRHNGIYQQDVTNLYKFFHDELAKIVGQVKYTADELIKKMNWEGRIKAVFSHDFYVDPEIYQPNSTTITDLSQAIDSLPGGYLFLEGGPGSGKSSLLTQWAIGRPERVVKYFAYLNQTSGNQPIRGEAVNLFHDLSIQLTENGFFGSTVFSVQRDLTQTYQVFENQLQQVGELYQRQRTKTIIIIDGLDHLPREYAKQGTFLEHLPQPTDIPEGVYIILGSQSFELTNLTASVRQAAEQPGRKIVIQPLLPIAVSRIADKILDQQLTSLQHDLLFLASEGHPLFLQYILRTLHNEPASRPIEEQLADLPPFDQDISLYYGRMWEEFETDEDIADLLGLVCRLRFGFHPSMRREWSVTLPVARKAKRWFNQFFDESFGFNVFFHNSFRQFLLTKTAEDPLTGQRDDATHLQYHARLADWSATSKVRLFHHEHLYHVHQARQIDRFYQTLTPEYVDKQRYQFRPFDSIRDDLSTGLQLASEAQNLQFTLRYGFLMAELYRREWNLDQNHFLDYFPDLFDFESVTEYALLPIDSPDRRSRALKIVQLLYRNNLETDARKLFVMAEPAAYASGDLLIDAENGFHWQEQIKPLEEWVRTKCLWADPKELLQKIVNLQVTRNGTGEHVDRERQKKQEEITTRLLDALIQSLVQTQPYRRRLLDVFSQFDYKHPGNIKFFLPRLHNVITVCLQGDDREQAASLLASLLKDLAPADLSSEQRILIAQMLYDVDRSSNKYKEWISDVVLAPLTITPMDTRTEGTLDYYQPYFMYVSLETIQHNSIDLSVLFPNAADEQFYDPIVTDWFKMMARTAIIKGEGLRGDPFNVRHLLPIVRFYYRPKPKQHAHGQYRMDWARTAYYRQVVESISVYGSEALSKATTFFESEMTQYSTHWSAELKFEIWLTFLRFGLGKERVKQLIDGVAESVITEQQDLDSRMNQALRLSETYLELNVPDKAQFWLLRAADESLGIGFRKDYQLNDWIAWLTKANTEEPEMAGSRIRWMASHLDHIDQTTDGRAASSRAAYSLLNCCIAWNPAAGLELFVWLLKRKYVDVDDGIELLLDKLFKEEISLALLTSTADLFGKVLLFSSTSVSSETFSKLVQLLQQHHQYDLLDELVKDVERYALQEKRSDYYRLLAAANVSFSPAKGFPMNPLEQSGERLATIRLVSDTQITQTEFLEKYTTAAQLQELIKEVYETSGKFDWLPCFQKIEHEVDEPWIIQTLSNVGADRHSAFWLILALGELAHRKSYTNASKTISSSLLDFKDASWSPFIDGGRRLCAFAFAIKVEGEKARVNAWFDFSRQFQKTSSAELLRELDEVIPVLVPSSTVQPIWAEVETYLRRMFIHVTPSSDVPELAVAPIEDKPEALIARLTLNFSLLAERGLRETSLAHLARQTATANDGYISELRRFMSNTKADIDWEVFAKIVLYLDVVSPVLLSDLVNELLTLANSSLLSSRIVANTILDDLEEPVQPSPSIQLPLVWLHTAPGEISQELELRRFNEAISDGWNGSRFSKEHLFNFLTHRLEPIVRLTGIELKKLLGRAVDLFVNELQNGDGRLQKLAQGNEVGLESTYYPYAVIVPFLIDRLVSELNEGGYLPDPEGITQLMPLFDPFSLQFEQYIRPKEIPGVRGFEAYYALPSDWIDHTDEGFSHFAKQLDNTTVLAERTIFRGLSWDLSTELRESCWTIDTGPASHRFPAGAFYRMADLLVTEYVEMSFSPSIPIQETPLIIANYAERLLDTPSYLSEWVAINPDIASSLGWRLSDPLRFEWVDDNDNVMVRSYYWVDGNVRMKPPQLRSQAGGGWIVTASDQAIELLKGRFKLIQKFHIDRQIQNSSSSKPTHQTLSRIETITASSNSN